MLLFLKCLTRSFTTRRWWSCDDLSLQCCKVPVILAFEGCSVSHLEQKALDFWGCCSPAALGFEVCMVGS